MMSRLFAVRVIEHEYIGNAAENDQGANGASGRLSGKETPVDVNGRSLGEDGAADNLSKENISKSSKMDLFKRHNKRKSQYQPIPKEDVIFSITKKTAGLALMEIGGSDGEPYGILLKELTGAGSAKLVHGHEDYIKEGCILVRVGQQRINNMNLQSVCEVIVGASRPFTMAFSRLSSDESTSPANNQGEMERSCGLKICNDSRKTKPTKKQAHIIR